MTRKELIIEMLNRWVNIALSLTTQVLCFLNIYPGMHRGTKRIRKRSVGRELIRGYSFKKVFSTHWGSAPPGMDSVFNENCVVINYTDVTVNAFNIPGAGFPDGTKENPPTEVAKEVVAGKAQTDYEHSPDGWYSAIITLSAGAKGSWDSWWFLADKGDGYQEVDMFEIFKDKYNRTWLKTSIHNGESADQENRPMYGYSYRVPSHRFHMAIRFGKKTMKVYVNGWLVFVGWQWKPTKDMKMIINNGLHGDAWQDPEVKKSVRRGDHSLSVSFIHHDYIR